MNRHDFGIAWPSSAGRSASLDCASDIAALPERMEKDDGQCGQHCGEPTSAIQRSNRGRLDKMDGGKKDSASQLDQEKPYVGQRDFLAELSPNKELKSGNTLEWQCREQFCKEVGGRKGVVLGGI